MGTAASAQEALKGVSAQDLKAFVGELPAEDKAKLKDGLAKLQAGAQSKPKVMFVLGGPGAGKGTQCAKIVENFAHWSHISAGDCLRAERNNPDSESGELINGLIKEGKLVPSSITVGLVVKEMTAQQASGKTSFLIDGFPRSVENVGSWNEVVGDKADVLGLLFYEANEEELEKRLLVRGETSGRADDNIESIKKRFRTYLDETMPVVESGRYKVYKIDGMPPVDEVWEKTTAAIKEAEAKPRVLFVLGPPGAGKGTQCGKIVENFPNWSHISAGDCLRAERNKEGSEVGELINNLIKEGKLVPSDITVGLVYKDMRAQMAQGKTSFLVDGFPRSAGNVDSWQEVVGDSAEVLGVLFYEASEDELEKRLVARGETSGRADDNIETIKKRFVTYMDETKPVVDSGKYEIFRIDGMPPEEEVWKVTTETISKFQAA